MTCLHLAWNVQPGGPASCRLCGEPIGVMLTARGPKADLVTKDDAPPCTCTVLSNDGSSRAVEQRSDCHWHGWYGTRRPPHLIHADGASEVANRSVVGKSPPRD